MSEAKQPEQKQESESVESKTEVKSEVTKPLNPPVIVLTNAEGFKNSIAAISNLISEINFHFTTEGVSMLAMDPANVSMINFFMKKEAFTTYDVEGDQSFGLNLSHFKTILRRVGKKDVLKIRFGDRIQLVVESANKRTFYIPTIELDENIQKIPKLTFAATATLPLTDFRSAVEDADIIGETVQFSAKNKVLELISQGDLKTYNIEMGDDVSLVHSEDVSSKYALEYLKKMMITKISEIVVFKWNNDHPCKLLFESEDKLIRLEYILAPRVDND